MPQRIELSKSLLQQLKQAGYTHMQLRGIEDKPAGDDSDTDDYILVPRRAGIVQFEESDLPVETIDSTDITDMLGVEFGIRFWVEVPDEA